VTGCTFSYHAEKEEDVMRLTATILVLMMILTMNCYDTVEVDLSGLDEETLGFFGVPDNPASMYLYILAEYSEFGLPDVASGSKFRVNWPVNGPMDLMRRSPEGEVEWVWFRNPYIRVRFREWLDMSVSSITPQVPGGELAVGDLYVCDTGEDYCVEFKVHNLNLYRLDPYGRVVIYRVDVLFLFEDKWHFLYGGCPVMDSHGPRALWFTGWVDKEKIDRLMGKEKSGIVKVVVTDFLAKEQREAVCLFNR